MVDEDVPVADGLAARGMDEPETVIVGTGTFGAIARAAGSATALAVAALIIATATMLNMSAANDIADAKLYNARGFNTLKEIRWVAGTRLSVAVVALLIAIVAGIRYARGLPATVYTFSAGGEEATESVEGADAPGWVTLLVGSAVAVSVLAILLNVVALALALRLHESPNFGVPTG